MPEIWTGASAAWARDADTESIANNSKTERRRVMGLTIANRNAAPTFRETPSPAGNNSKACRSEYLLGERGYFPVFSCSLALHPSPRNPSAVTALFNWGRVGEKHASLYAIGIGCARVVDCGGLRPRRASHLHHRQW